MKRVIAIFACIFWVYQVAGQSKIKNDSLAFNANDTLTIKDKKQLLREAKNRADSLKIGFWKPRNAQFGINFSQASFNNWQGGGTNNWSIGALFNNRSEYYKNKGAFTGEVQFQLGTVNNRGQRPAKSIDRLFMETKYSHKLNPKINWFGTVNFLTQFAKGVVYQDDGLPTEQRRTISGFLAPGYLSEGFGVEYKPVSYFLVQLGGATLRHTFVLNDKIYTDFTEFNKSTDAYGIAPGKKVLTEMGFQMVASLDKDIIKNVNLKCRYQAFQAYVTRKLLPNKNTIDHNINLIATAKVNRYLNLNFTMLAIYDKDQIDKFQISQAFAAGLLFKL
ncbi:MULTISPECIES: DUF3078 domain-containing protein [Emticicia]|uniref:DUF3078 domain-containing protein n=1 Tax=Emticicia TaxID=312278 RepID=UPI0020A129C3|nr:MULTISPECIES: DUF3078 domain-containing protein [Emticicia]UTA67767.1 DUF3078 domain-containing protein [Emticicia sp. 21SJ11W-3]